MATKKKEKTEAKQAKSFSRFLRISPRKLRLIVDLVRYKPAHKAMSALAAMPNKGARITEKVLKSAIANAKDIGLEEDKLIVKAIYADGGPTFKRFRPRSMGRADRILKRTSHLSIFLEEGKKSYRRPGAVVEAVEETQGGSAKPKAKKKPRKKAAAGAA